MVHARLIEFGDSCYPFYCVSLLIMALKQSIIIIINDINNAGWACGGV